jgi:hypothetical protein
VTPKPTSILSQTIVAILVTSALMAGCADAEDKGVGQATSSKGGKSNQTATGGGGGSDASGSGGSVNAGAAGMGGLGIAGTNNSGVAGTNNSGVAGTNNSGVAGTNHAGAAGFNSTGIAGASGGSALPTLFLVGDSTVSSFNDAYYYPRYGYGTQIGKYLNQNIVVNNLALSGRSSKSFINPVDNAKYAELTAGLKAGDYLMIGFGHNDEKADSSLYTNPVADVTDPTSFKYYLYNYYIQPALRVGATPILMTPVVRRDASGAYAGAKAHITTDVVSGGVSYPGGNYPQAIRDLGALYGVTVIDTTALTMALGKEIFAASGAAGTANLQAWVSDAITSVDDTHTNVYGASYYSYLIANALTTSSSTLKNYVLPGIVPPDLATTVIPNPNYVPSTYTPPVKGALWTTTDPWIGSVFGDVGGQTKVTDPTLFGISETSASPLAVTMHSGSTTGAVGKIATATDGIAFYFQQVPLEKDFVLSATATVTFITYNNSQSGFGLMIRDAAWIDKSDASLLSSYVACGTLKGNNPASAWSSFARDMSAATPLFGTTVSSATVVPQASTVLPLTITKAGSTYTCTYGTEAPSVYTVDLNLVDSKYVYAGLFTARQCEVAFSNISLTLTN